MTEWYDYDNLEPAPPEGYDWSPGARGKHPDDQIDFHLDLGAGNLRKGRLTIDRHGPVDLTMNLDPPFVSTPIDMGSWHPPENFEHRGLPFADESIHSIITHHCFEHIGTGFMELMDECYRVLRPSGKFRIIVPLFPSFNSISDPDHKRYFCKDSFEMFVHNAGEETPHWSESFAPSYTKARFKQTSLDYTPPRKFKSNEVLDIDKLFEEGREMRITLQKPAP